MAETKQAKAPSDPKLWAVAKRRARATTEGSPAGRWSVGKALLAQRQYEKWGGKWKQIGAPAKPPRGAR